MNPYETLGVNRDADAATIKRAHRRRSQKAHPDKGGSSDEFHAVQLAYQILIDDARRDRFDKTGDCNEKNQHQLAMQTLANMIVNLVDNAPDVDHQNIVEMMREVVKTRQANFENEIREIKRKAAKRRRAARRVRHSGGGANLLQRILEDNILVLERKIAGLQEEREFGVLLLQILAEYGYDVELIVPQSAGRPFLSFTSTI